MFLPRFAYSFVSEEIYYKTKTTAFLYSLNQNFYVFSIEHYSYELHGLNLLIVISELLCYAIIFGAVAFTLLYNREEDLEDDEEELIPEEKQPKTPLEKRLDVIDKLIVYKEAELITDKEFSDIKTSVLNDENYNFNLSDRDFESLKKLKRLYDEEVLTAVEFESEKKKLINS